MTRRAKRDARGMRVNQWTRLFGEREMREIRYLTKHRIMTCRITGGNGGARGAGNDRDGICKSSRDKGLQGRGLLEIPSKKRQARTTTTTATTTATTATGTDLTSAVVQSTP